MKLKNVDAFKEINEKGLELDKQLKKLRDEYAELLTKYFEEDDVEALNDVLQVVNAKCFSYYRYRIHTKLIQIQGEDGNDLENE
ncbi:hypothetical protein ABEX78_24045 [Priestia megaterium]